MAGLSRHEAASAANPRRSMGGSIVEQSLHRVGYRPRPGVVLVETARPVVRPFGVVLVQNAWNFIPTAALRDRINSYPPRMQGKILARRGLARLNTRRAGRVLALTQAMADLTSEACGREVEVASVTLPLDLELASSAISPKDPPQEFVLVPGTVTWHKESPAAPAAVIERDLPRRILLAGRDDGSGCLARVRDEADRSGVELEHRALSRPQMIEALQTASATVLPSRLESLGFSLAEALVLCSGHVVAHPLASHRELADRLGREACWWSQPLPARATPAVTPATAVIRGEWQRLRERLEEGIDG